MGRALPSERDDWYNLSDDLMFRAPGVEGERQKSPSDMTSVEKEAYTSFEQCQKACKEHSKCFQFVYHDQTCGFSFSYRLGYQRDPEGDEGRYKSGWILDKIEKDRQDHPCKTPEWL